MIKLGFAIDRLEVGPLCDEDARLTAVVVEVEELGRSYRRRVVNVVRRDQTRHDRDVAGETGEVQQVEDADDLVRLAAVAERREVCAVSDVDSAADAHSPSRSRLSRRCTAGCCDRSGRGRSPKLDAGHVSGAEEALTCC